MFSLSSKQININNGNKKTAANIDDEWSSFISNHYQEDVSDDEADNNGVSSLGVKGTKQNDLGKKTYNNENAPTPSDIYISTKSKIAYLTEPVDLKVFWTIPIIPYATPCNGVIKKQIKINSKSQEELDEIQLRLQKELYFDEHIMSHIDNPSGRIKFKDIRKITIGISKKDIMSYRSKKKQAFYNCFVMIIRLKVINEFKEFHIKVFNTGKLEIPGVQNDAMFELVLTTIISILQPHSPTQLCYNKKSDTVLINSNFNCGFFIDREALYDILKYKYNIQAIYDPCSYPGIQCKFYYNKDIGVQTGKQISTENKAKHTNIVEVSFMIFRTGSCLIVGNCSKPILLFIFKFIRRIMIEEKDNISMVVEDTPEKSKVVFTGALLKQSRSIFNERRAMGTVASTSA